MSKKRTKHGNEVCSRRPDSSYSDVAIHEAIMAGVDDSDIRARTRAKLVAAGVPITDLDRVLPLAADRG